MKKWGCLLSWIILILFVSGVYAVNGLFSEDIKSPDYYAVNVRAMFKQGQWEEGKRLLDEGLRYYTKTNELNELNGQYYYHHKDYDNARYYLIVACRDNPENVTAKQLLVKVEEETENYSSAICYINELLEINPYWRGLWRKKIGIFRLQGNHVEADRLLKRLHQIYPNDSTVQRDYAGSLEEKFLRERKAGNRNAVIASLYDLTEVMPDNEEYYLLLSNLLLQEGNVEEALEVAGRGASNMPRSSQLIVKKASILGSEGRYQEALAFVKSRMRYNRSATLARFYNHLLAEAANAAKMNDPYVLHGQLYANTGSSEALDYMLNTSITRGYNEDALYYLAEAKRRRGETPSLLYKEYMVYKRMGNVNKAYSLLNTLAAIDSTNTDVADELALNRLQQAGNLISDGLYSEALPYVKAAARHSYDPDITASALNREYACYYEMRRYDEALAALDSMYAVDPNDMDYFIRKSDILNRQGHAMEALDMLDSLMSDSIDMELRPVYVSAYEEIAVPYIKGLIEDGASFLALSESSRLLAHNPSSVEGLQYAIGMSDLLGRHDTYDYYVDLARSIYPDRTDFIVKKAVSYSRNGEYERVVDMLHPWLEKYPHNEGIVGAYAENSELLAYRLIKEHQPDSALAVVDSALAFDAGNEALLMAKGVAYESMHEYDSAYHYQLKYTPGAEEAASFKRHLDGLESRSFKNEISAEYLQGRYGEADVLTSVATLSYTRELKNDDLLSARLNYAGRDGSAAGEDPEDQVPGGVGVQLQASWTHAISSKWSLSLTGGVASRYFPDVMAEAKLEHYFDRDVTADVHVGYRRISTYSKDYRWDFVPETGEGAWAFDGWDEYKTNFFSLGVGATKYWERVALGGKVDGFFASSDVYVNAAVQFKYYPLNDGRTSIIVTGSAGTAPEANIIDNAMPGTFDKLNTSVGLGGIYMINKHLSAGLMGTWNTFYSQLNNRNGEQMNYSETITTRYRNLYNIHLQLYVHF